MSEKIKPLEGIKLKGNRILVKNLEPIKTTKGGLLLPETSWIPREGGEIVSIGPDVEDGISVGNRIRYNQHGSGVDIDGESYFLLRDGDIWGDMI